MTCLCSPYIDVLVNYMRMQSSKSAIGCTLNICGLLQATLVVCALQRRLHRCLWESLAGGSWRAVTSREQGGLEGRWLQAMVGPGCGHQRFLLSVPSDPHLPCPYVLCHVGTGCHGSWQDVAWKRGEGSVSQFLYLFIGVLLEFILFRFPVVT